jgi:hypothetical protein
VLTESELSHGYDLCLEGAVSANTGTAPSLGLMLY